MVCGEVGVGLEEVFAPSSGPRPCFLSEEGSPRSPAVAGAPGRELPVQQTLLESSASSPAPGAATLSCQQCPQQLPASPVPADNPSWSPSSSGNEHFNPRNTNIISYT